MTDWPGRYEGRWPGEAVEPIDRGTAYLRGLGDSLSWTFGDEAMGGIAGTRAAARRDPVRTALLGPLGASLSDRRIAEDYLSAYRRQADQSRENLDTAERQHPVSTAAGQITGYIAPGFGVSAAARTGTGLAGRFGRAALAGGAAGAVTGVGSGVTPEERLSGGAWGGITGAALGAGAHGILGEAAPALWAAGRRAAGLPQQAGRMGVAERALDDLTTVARQNERLGVRSQEDLRGVINSAAAREPTQTVAEALGRSAINRVVRYSRLPGRTAERAEQVLERNADTFEELTQRLDDTLTPRTEAGDVLTVRDAKGELDALFSQTSTEGYQTALAQTMNSQQLARLQDTIRRNPEFYKRAIDEAMMIARSEGITGLQGISDPRLWHYIKVGAGDTLRTMRREGLGATRARLYTRSIHSLRDELDLLPGYKEARQRWGSLSEAREALEAGFSFDKMRPQEVADLMKRLTPFQRRYLQAGVSARVRDTLERRDNDGLINIARDLTNRRRSDLMRAAFGDKSGSIDEFLRYARLRRQMHNDASRMASSRESPTGIVTGEGLASAIPTGSLSLRSGALKLAFDNTIGRMGERNRDALGRVLLTPVGDFARVEGGLLTRAMREARRRKSKQRLARTRGAYLSGLGASGVYDPMEQQ